MPEKPPREDRGPFWAVAISTVLGLGFTPRMPGTVGAAAGFFLFVPAFFLQGEAASIVPLSELLAVGLLAALSIPPVLKATGQRDPSYIVIDEVAGVLCALCIAPQEFVWSLIAFVLFRILDIFKPFPVDKLERLKGAWGVVADDLGAGILAGVLTLVMRRLL